LCPEGTPFPECLFGGNDGFRKSLIEFDWEANGKSILQEKNTRGMDRLCQFIHFFILVYHSIVIRFIVGLLCDYMCRRIFAFLLNSPALNRQVAFWDKMKRFFIDILPRPLSDLLFQNPSPLQTTDVSTQTEPQGIDAYAQTDSFAQGIDASAQAEPIVQTAGTSTQTEVPELTSRRLSPTSHRSFLWPQQAINILKPRVSISDEIRDRSRVFQLPEESYFLRDE
jgi:hypothetical protein